MKFGKLLVATGLSLVGSFLVPGVLYADLNSQTVMSTNVGDQRNPQEGGTIGQEAGTVANDPRDAAASGAMSQELKRKRTEEQSLNVSAAERLALAPHAIMVHTQLLSAKDELNGIRSQLGALPKGTAPDSEAIQHLSIYAKNINQDLIIASAHQAELRSGVNALPSGGTNRAFTQMDSSVDKAIAANTGWQAKAKLADYWKNTDDASSDIKKLSDQIDHALDRNQSFGSDQLAISFVG